MFVSAIYSIKGGVGKTAAAVNLAALASYEGAKTLLIDLDPQASSTFYLRVKPKIKTTVKKLIKGKSPVENLIKSTDLIHLDLLPATTDFREMEMLLGKVSRPAERIQEMLEPIRDTYTWVFIDCPPGMTMLAESIFNASDLILVPVVPTTLSVRTYADLRKYMLNRKPGNTPYLGFFSMADRRKSIQRSILQDWDFKEQHFSKSIIPYLSDVEKMGLYRKPVVTFKPSCTAAKAFAGLWKEIKKAAGKTAASG